ncbi:MAG: DNA recombination protein RmuC [Clostridiales bacterium]|jgi:DNA recombination protein RmuC|nr:DNA recombination protein RmuC [Clostridiales bacterium]MDY4655740.1 DNA recombination protein RmuC [Eubacteriales bacterium]
MCFYRKKLYKQQQDILNRLNDLEKSGQTNREVITTAMKISNDTLIGGIKSTVDAVADNVRNMTVNNETRLTEVKEELRTNLTEIRTNVEGSLKSVREDNEKQLSAMREVVEEKLAGSLNERLNATFNAINERLDAVNKGLGEMQALNNGVTDLKKVLANVKTRGMWGEVSLENILDGILTKEQYATQQNVTGKRNGEAVDFAIILPGKKEGRVYLPIDVKFPLEDYQRMVEASDRGDLEETQNASRALENAVKIQAKSISSKYINPPYTTDFAIMYLPIEGLYAEIIRNPGLSEELQRKHKVIPAGPTTISAILNSLQLGFRTLAIQRSSREVFDLLAGFKKDFTTFMENIETAQRQVATVGHTLETATKRNEIIMKKLNKAETLTIPETEE